MQPVAPQIQALEEESYRIVGMICSERASENEIEGAVEALRLRTAEVFPDSPRVFDATYGRRFKRLRTRFRPGRGLFDG